MKHIKFSLFLLLLNVNLYAQQMPTFKQVVNTFFDTYTFSSQETYLKFYKKKDGWYITEDYYAEPGRLTNQDLFWSAKENDFKVLNYPKANGDSISISNQVEKYLQSIDFDYLQYPFARIKYYGYSGWDWDVINEPIDRNNMTDTLWEGIARANSNYAAGFLFDQSRDLFQNGDPDRILLKDVEKISTARTKKFMVYMNKAIDAYKEIIKLNPNYETKVGNIKLKCANEYIFAYCDLMMAGDTLHAKQFLVDVNYPDSIIKLSKQYLDAISKNGILFTGGDNDTYPLWYVQQTAHYRTDVLVLNTSLLGLRRFVKMIDNQFKGKLFTSKDSVYNKQNFDYFLYNKTSKKSAAVPVGKFIETLNKAGSFAKSSDETLTYNGELIKKYDSKEVYFPIKSGTGASITVSKVIKLNDFLFMPDFLLLDIINCNINKRPIYFSYQHELFTNVLTQQGMVYKIQLTN